MASASSHATMRAACSPRVTSARAEARAAPTQPPASTSGRPMATAPAFFRRRVARARRVRAGAEDSSRPVAEPFVTPEDVRRGEVARSWVSELYDCVDYAAVFAAAEEAAVDDDGALDALADDGIEAVEPALHRVFLYNPPYTLPFLRRNELAVVVALPDSAGEAATPADDDAPASPPQPPRAPGTAAGGYADSL